MQPTFNGLKFRKVSYLALYSFYFIGMLFRFSLILYGTGQSNHSTNNTATASKFCMNLSGNLKGE
jgi:1-aminocyclopropane-1-carboxylate deaminase/D-cysteine desulfhydrase-like pyridoxal-dependent ACC family enzyme